MSGSFVRALLAVIYQDGFTKRILHSHRKQVGEKNPLLPKHRGRRLAKRHSPSGGTALMSPFTPQPGPATLRPTLINSLKAAVLEMRALYAL